MKTQSSLATEIRSWSGGSQTGPAIAGVTRMRWPQERRDAPNSRPLAGASEWRARREQIESSVSMVVCNCVELYEEAVRPVGVSR